jgi:hypothetical protein
LRTSDLLLDTYRRRRPHNNGAFSDKPTAKCRRRKQAFSNIVEEYILYGREEIVPIPLRPEIIEEEGRVMGGFTAVLEEGELEAGAMRAVYVEGVMCW